MLSCVLVIWTFLPRSVNAYVSAGENRINQRGHSVFRSAHLEVAGAWPGAPRIVRSSTFGAAISYHRVRQAHSWFGYRDGEGDDNIRAESLYLFIRRERRYIFFDIGSGPMWSNRRIPAATSRLNFNSQLTIGAMIGPLRLAYRFSHISNGGLVRRNPGLNVNALMIGMPVRKLTERRRSGAP